MDNKDEKQPPVAGAWEVRGVRVEKVSQDPMGKWGLNSGQSVCLVNFACQVLKPNLPSNSPLMGSGWRLSE